jgi:GNAT superfamily N-acetyltransferase
MEDLRWRWLDGPTCDDADWERIEQILIARGWMSLNRATSRILISETEEEGKLASFLVLQLVPHTEPLWVAPEFRATGLAEQMVDAMVKFLNEVQIRGYLATAESPFAAKLCEEHGMKKLEHPVYIKVGMSPVKGS